MLAWVLLVVAAFIVAYWAAILFRVLRMSRRETSIRSGLALPEPPGGWPEVSIVIPAHDEERVIDQCASSLRRQDYPGLEVIFVLDRCTDRTATILQGHADADDRFRLLHNDHCPETWAGKCHAAHLGAEAARGRVLLFADADTIFEQGLVQAAVAVAGDRDLALLSLVSTLTSDHAFERIVQPVASFTLGQIHPIDSVNRGGRPFANGQFLLFDRSWYERIGGHEAVRDDLLEDLAFARRIHAEGGRINVLFADGMFVCSMYGSLEAFERGWQRIFIEACRREPARLAKYGWRTAIAAVPGPVLQVCSLVFGVMLVTTGTAPGALLLGVVLAGSLLQALTLRRIYAWSRVPAAWVLTYPVGCWVVSRILLEAARILRRGEPITWGGRRYVLEPR